MDMSAKRAGHRVRAALLGLGALAAVVVPATQADAATAVGRFTTLTEGTNRGYDISGIALITRTGGGTSGRVVVIGLEPGRTYAAHLHAAACSAGNPGGGHYQNDPPPPATPPNELWFSSTSDPFAGITANRAGVAVGRGSADWIARAEARSVVIHYIPDTGGSTAGGPKIACADLE